MPQMRGSDFKVWINSNNQILERDIGQNSYYQESFSLRSNSNKKLNLKNKKLMVPTLIDTPSHKKLGEAESKDNSLQHLTEKSDEEESDANIKIAKSNNAMIHQQLS